MVISNFIGVKEERSGLDFSIIARYEGRKLTHLLIVMNFFLLVDRN